MFFFKKRTYLFLRTAMVRFRLDRISLNPIQVRVGYFGKIKAGHCASICLSFICDPTTTKLGMVVPWD